MVGWRASRCQFCPAEGPRTGPQSPRPPHRVPAGGLHDGRDRDPIRPAYSASTRVCLVFARVRSEPIHAPFPTEVESKMASFTHVRTSRFMPPRLIRIDAHDPVHVPLKNPR
jgi:hypothetical protein